MWPLHLHAISNNWNLCLFCSSCSLEYKKRRTGYLRFPTELCPTCAHERQNKHCDLPDRPYCGVIFFEFQVLSCDCHMLEGKGSSHFLT